MPAEVAHLQTISGSLSNVSLCTLTLPSTPDSSHQTKKTSKVHFIDLFILVYRHCRAYCCSCNKGWISMHCWFGFSTYFIWSVKKREIQYFYMNFQCCIALIRHVQIPFSSSSKFLCLILDHDLFVFQRKLVPHRS